MTRDRVQAVRTGSSPSDLSGIAHDLRGLAYSTLKRFGMCPWQSRCDEVAQEWCVRALLQPGAICSLDGCKARALMMSVVGSLAERGKRQHASLHVHADVAGALAARSREGISEALADQVAAAVGSLPDEFQQLVLMHFYDGLSHRQIARKLKLTERSVKERIRCGLKVLKTLLARDAHTMS